MCTGYLKGSTCLRDTDYSVYCRCLFEATLLTDAIYYLKGTPSTQFAAISSFKKLNHACMHACNLGTLSGTGAFPEQDEDMSHFFQVTV